MYSGRMISSEPEFARRPAPWAKARGLEAVWSEWSGRNERFGLDAWVSGRGAQPAALPSALPPALRSTLERRGIDALFSHQHEAYSALRAGQHTVIATPTASGKSLCYNLPVLEALSQDRSARALYLFPTKALSRDQESVLCQLLREASIAQGAVTYDGDTPGDARRAAREQSAVILSNPDMLHAGILPHHSNWARFFSGLRYVVIDELHSYRGVFGSHLANVIRRLKRICAFHGSAPTFAFASATIGNPEEHASRMLGEPVRGVLQSGAPQSDRRLVVYNPPVVNAELGIRANYQKSAVRLTADLVRAEVATLVFGQSRNGVEVMLKYLRDRLRKDDIDPQSIQAYRGGYLPNERRQIERDLRDGRIRCVVATNALELGIDVGALDAVVCAGYPGSMASLWQRFGRAGRRGRESLLLLVTSSMPLDQFVAANPETLLQNDVEHARIDPDNAEILLQHLKCAAFELPFEPGESFGDLPTDVVTDALGYLADGEVLHRSQTPAGPKFHWISSVYPANDVSLRSLADDNFVIVDLERDINIAEMDWHSVHTMLHEQAIYQHAGEQYQVERLDYDNHKAFVRKVAPDYYTTAMTHTRVNILDVEELQRLGLRSDEAVEVGLGEVSVIEKVVGYKKIKFHSHENVGYGEVDLPEMQMHTTACWFTFPENLLASFDMSRAEAVDALRGLANAFHLLSCVGLMVDPRDLRRTLGSRHDDGELPGKGGDGPGFDPTIFVFDAVPGGVGLAPRVYEERERLLRKAATLLEHCFCESGCPACIGPAVSAQEADATGATEARSMLDGINRKEQLRTMLRAMLSAPSSVGEVR